MSIIAHLRQITAAEAGQFPKQPDLAYKLILGAGKDAAAQTSRELETWKIRNAIPLLQIFGAGGKLENMSPSARAAFEKSHQEFTQIAHGRILGAMGSFREGQLPRKPRGLSLEKAWHAIHYLLTGQDEGGKPPLAWAVLCDKEIPDMEKLMGYGPARLLTPEQVKWVRDALLAVKHKELRARFDAPKMLRANIYGVRRDDGFDYFGAYISSLKAYYKQAARLGKGMLGYLD